MDVRVHDSLSAGTQLLLLCGWPVQPALLHGRMHPRVHRVALQPRRVHVRRVLVREMRVLGAPRSPKVLQRIAHVPWL